MSDPRFDATMRVAERVAGLLADRGVDCVMIGALALAAHGHPRATEDLDLAVAVPPRQLAELAEVLRAEGFDVEVRMPDAQDPLGGVMDVRSPDAELVQVVNFDNSPAGGFPRLVRDAIPRSARLQGTSLSVVDAAMLAAFKLYAGGPDSAADVRALLDGGALRLTELRELCDSLRLRRQLDAVLARRDSAP